MIDRYELRALSRHPWHWIILRWAPLVIAVGFISKGWRASHDVFGVMVGAWVWPYLLVGTGLLILVSTVVLHSRWTQWVTGTAIAAVAALRVASYIAVIVAHHLHPETISEGAAVLAWYLASVWLIVHVVGLVWDRIVAPIACAAAIEVGTEDRSDRGDE